MEVLVRYDVADQVLSADTVVSYLCTGRRCTRGRSHRSLVAGIEAAETLLSVEVRGDSSRRAARARYTIEPLQCSAGDCLSDLLLFDATTASDAETAESVLPKSLTSFVLSNRMPLGVYWELRQTSDNQGPISVSLTVSPVRVSLGRRLATRLHLAPAVAPVSLNWQATSSAGLQHRHVTLRLPENARGRYRVTLTIESPQGSKLVATRDIHLRS